MIDQLHRKISLLSDEPRIVSVVPSQTELLYDLGLESEVVGITKFCIHPNRWYKNKVRVGGTKNLNLQTIRKLHPTLILANKEENDKLQIEQLSKEFPTWISDINNFAQALEMIEKVGKVVGKVLEAKRIILEIKRKQLELYIPKGKKKVLYLIWQNPIMVVGKNTFIDDMISVCGFTNVVEDVRYPTLSMQQVVQLNPDLLFLSSEPYPFKEAHALEWKQILPEASVKLVDGELFSWYGSRMLHSFDYFRALNEELA